LDIQKIPIQPPMHIEIIHQANGGSAVWDEVTGTFNAANLCLRQRSCAPHQGNESLNDHGHLKLHVGSCEK
jgi:hypothetical protein